MKDRNLYIRENKTLKKILAFLRSMTFGMILLCGVLLCSFAGSLIPQQQSAMHYVNLYGERPAMAILALGLDDVFARPYFAALMAALCLNLLLCSVLRVRSLRGAGDRLRCSALAAKMTPVTEKQADALHAHFAARRWKKTQQDGKTLYTQHLLGFYGSFLTHLGLLALLIVGGLVLTGADVMDRTVMPGGEIVLEDGARVGVQDFRIEDETGRLDFMSTVQITAPDGSQSEWKQIRVNEPLRFDAYKVYQQTYGTAGSVRVSNEATGGSESVMLTEPVFLTLDGVNGVYFQTLYAGYLQDAEGNFTLIGSTDGEYDDPVYDIRVLSAGETTAVLAFPGDELSVGGVRFAFEAPVEYPGLRIKRQSGVLLGALYASFVLMTAALYVCFFLRPVCVCVGEAGYALASPKQQMGLQLEIEGILGKEVEGK